MLLFWVILRCICIVLLLRIKYIMFIGLAVFVSDCVWEIRES